MPEKNVFAACYTALMEEGIEAKVSLTRNLAREWREGKLSLETKDSPRVIPRAGRPPKPDLVAPRDVPKRDVRGREGHAALVHAITHIEFNAINLALDAVYRFRDMPRAFYADWLRVADEEAYHFTLLRARLKELGFDYGDFPAHDGLWEMAVETAHDVMVRMALVPRVLEARGLDATPRIVKRLRDIGDEKTVDILENVIFRDEIGHVRIGSHWFHYCCEQRGLDAEATFRQLIEEHFRGQLRGPLHLDARRRAGFSDAELTNLQSLLV